MELRDLIKALAMTFDALGIPYFLTGAITTIFYGAPRLTADIDIVADVRADHIDGLRAAFPHPDYYLSEQAVREAVEFKSQFNIIHPASGLKIDVMVPEMNAYNINRFQRIRKDLPIDELEPPLASPEDVILMKMKYYKQGGSGKHVSDIGSILEYQGRDIDFAYVEKWADFLDVRDVWRNLKIQFGIET